MAIATRQFRVSCDHISSNYKLFDELVTVEKGAAGGWYWSHAKYGCSKDYSAPELAIEGMLRDHACRLIRINPAD